MDERANRGSLHADLSVVRSLLRSDVEEIGLSAGDPRVLMLAGLPGSGKSTFARKVTARHPFLVMESDRLRKTLVAEPQYTPDEHRRVFQACHRLLAEVLGHGYPVLFDATNIGRRSRRPVFAIARRFNAPVAVVAVSAPLDVVRKRLQQREAGLDPETWSDAGFEVYSRMAPAWEPVNGLHIAVDTSRDTTPALRQVLEWTRSGRVPEAGVSTSLAPQTGMG